MTTFTLNETVSAPDVTLGSTTYKVEVQTVRWLAEDGTEREGVQTWLHGPRGGTYFLRGFLGKDDGLRQVVSWKSGAPLRVKGNEVRVYLLGNVIEVAPDF